MTWGFERLCMKEIHGATHLFLLSHYKGGICIAQSLKIPHNPKTEDYDKIIQQLLETRNARAIIIFGSEEDIRWGAQQHKLESYVLLLGCCWLAMLGCFNLQAAGSKKKVKERKQARSAVLTRAHSVSACTNIPATRQTWLRGEAEISGWKKAEEILFHLQ